MSRIGNNPIALPSGVDIAVNGNAVTVKGPKGELNIDLPEGITAHQDGDDLVVERPNNDQQSKA